MARRRPNFATIPPPPQEGLTERELAFYTAVKQNIEMLTNARTAELYPSQSSERTERIERINTYRTGSGLESTSATPTPFEQRLLDLRNRLDELNAEALPELEAVLTDLNEVVLPALQTELDSVLPITEVKISSDAITAPKIAANAIIAGKIAANAIAANEIASDTITGNMIKADTVTAFNIEANTITGNEIFGETLSAIFTDTGTLTANLIQTEEAPAGRIEITNDATDPVYAIWGGEGATKTDEDGRFWVKHDGDAKFGGRVFSSQLEGPIMDAVPIDLTGETITNTSNTVYKTVADRYIEVPALIDRPRRPFVNLAVPVYYDTANPSTGAWVQAQVAIQASDGSWGSWLPIIQEYTVDTTTNGSTVIVAGGRSEIGYKGFRFRVLFKPINNGEGARTNRFTGMFMGLPAGNGYSAVRDSTSTVVSVSSPLQTDIYTPPDFDTGWEIEP